MRTARGWVWPAVGLLLVGAGAALAGDDDEDGPPPSAFAQKRHGSVFNTMNRVMNPPGHGPKDEPAIPLRKGGKPSESGEGKAGAAPARPKTVDEEAIAERRQEEANLLRRQAACLRLLEIADESNDPQLQQLAERLDRRAFEAYQQRIAHLPVGGAAPEAEEPVRAAGRPAAGAKKSSGRPRAQEDKP